MSPKLLRNCLLLVFLISFGLILGATSQTTHAAPALRINEFMVSNASRTLDPDFTQFSDWIEIANTSSFTIDLTNYRLTDDLDQPYRWTFPAGTIIPPSNTLLLWADGENIGLHTNFKLNSSNESVALFAPNGTLVDSVDYANQLPDISYGRSLANPDEWHYFDNVTPDATNSPLSVAAAVRAPMPVTSVASGFYDQQQAVALTAFGASIHYTLDGSAPTQSSPIYSGPIVVPANTVLRARAFQIGRLPSPVTTASYFIAETTTLPVFSIVTDNDYFYDDEIGIYVAGTNGVGDECNDLVANYKQEWERPIHITLFEPDGSTAFATDAGIEIHGNCTRVLPQKSLAIRFRDEYGLDAITYPLLDKPVDTFHNFVLRNAGNDHNRARMRDALISQIVADRMDVDRNGFRPAIVFLNGDYFGIHHIREKTDDEYFSTNYDLDKNDIDFLENGGDVNVGDNLAYTQLIDYVNAHDLAYPAHYAYVKSQIDIGAYIDYYITHVYAGNYDWLNNNMKYWRERDGGQWRWLLYDLDWAYGYTVGYTANTLSWSFEVGGLPWRSELQRGLIASPEFRDEFIQRFAAHLNSTFAPARAAAFMDEIRVQLAPEMPRHIQRWSRPNSITTWTNELASIRNYIDNRPTAVFSHINAYFGLSGTIPITVATSSPNLGTVKINDVDMGDGSTGPYFSGVPLRITAQPMPGFRFVRWQETGSTDPTITITPFGSQSRTAVFAAIAPTPITINEIHYNPASSQGNDADFEFIELVNTGQFAVDLTDWSFAEGIEFTFPAATIAPGEFIVVARSASTTVVPPAVQRFQWTSGALSNDGERIQLVNQYGHLIDDVTYNDNAPWPTQPDGDGPSLTLNTPQSDNALASNWRVGRSGGSPGVPNNRLLWLPLVLK